MKENQNLCQIPELDAANYPEIREQVMHYENNHTPVKLRSYPGFPRWKLPHLKPRWLKSMDFVLKERRSLRKMEKTFPGKKILSRILQSSHGITAGENQGPTPSAGGLQALELYLATLEPSWLPMGIYHYNRGGHHLSQILPHSNPEEWKSLVPSMGHVSGGSLLWILVGNGERGEEKYLDRAYKFLLLEAGHLMQNLCLLSTSLGYSTVPLGAYFEKEIARTLLLPPGDIVLYTGICGKT